MNMAAPSRQPSGLALKDKNKNMNIHNISLYFGGSKKPCVPNMGSDISLCSKNNFVGIGATIPKAKAMPPTNGLKTSLICVDHTTRLFV